MYTSYTQYKNFFDKKKKSKKKYLLGKKTSLKKVLVYCAHSISNTGYWPAGKTVITSDHALKLEFVPDWIAIIGSGYIGLEFSDVYTALGSEVTTLSLFLFYCRSPWYVLHKIKEKESRFEIEIRHYLPLCYEFEIDITVYTLPHLLYSFTWTHWRFIAMFYTSILPTSFPFAWPSTLFSEIIKVDL